MNIEEKMKNLEEIKNKIEEHISFWRKEVRWLEEKIKKANDFLWEIKKEQINFPCKKGLSIGKAICGECERALPRMDGDVFLYPGNIKKKFFSEEEAKIRDCDVWLNKRKTGACGCAGQYFCICGYNFLGFCLIPPDTKVCPYCGRTCEIEFFNKEKNIFDLVFENMSGETTV